MGRLNAPSEPASSKLNRDVSTIYMADLLVIQNKKKATGWRHSARINTKWAVFQTQNMTHPLHHRVYTYYKEVGLRYSNHASNSNNIMHLTTDWSHPDLFQFVSCMPIRGNKGVHCLWSRWNYSPFRINNASRLHIKTHNLFRICI